MRADAVPPMPLDADCTDRGPLAAARRALLRAAEVKADQLASLRGWYPVAVDAAPPGVWWRDLGGLPFHDAFFSDTLRKQAREQRRRCFTDWNALRAPAADGMAPAAFIFHVSRCGSTLLARMLSALPSCVALSEPPVIDDFLRRHRHDADAAKRLRDLVHALGQRRDARERHLIIKLDSWQLRDLSLFATAFPGVPLLFLYRQPLQVLASHQRQRGPQMLPGMVDADWLGQAPGAPGDLDCYCLHVLAIFMRAALDAIRDGTAPLWLLNYRDLPHAAGAPLLASLGMASTAAERAAMQQRARLHAKDDAPFHGDALPLGGTGAPPDAALLAHCANLYAELESFRASNNFFDLKQCGGDIWL